MAISFIGLPAIAGPRNALLDFDPINQAIDRYRVASDAGYDRETNKLIGADLDRKDWSAAYRTAASRGDLNTAIKLRDVKAAQDRNEMEAQRFAEEREMRLAKRFAAISEAINAEPDEAKKRAMYDRVLGADPRMRGAIEQHIGKDADLKTVIDYWTRLADPSTPLQRRLQTAQVTEAEAKARMAQNPNLIYERRGEAARTYGSGLSPREQNEFVLTGDFPKAQTSIGQQVAERQAEVIRMGGDPNEPHTKQYILTGKFPREDQAPLTATDKKAILEADDAVLKNETAIRALREALDINDKANAGVLAGERAAVGANLPDLFVPDFVSSPESSVATQNFENLVLGQALDQLKSTFGAAPTEGERKILIDLQASVNKPAATRKLILERAIELADLRLAFNRQRAAEMRGGTYFKAGGLRLSKPISNMTLPELEALARTYKSQLSPEQAKEAFARYEALTRNTGRTED